MSISYFDHFGNEDYRITDFSHKKIDDDKILVTSIHGGWVVLSKKEFDLLRFGKLEKDPVLLKKLEKIGLITTERNKESIIDTYRTKKSFLLNSVNLHIISPTLRCNHRCVYCHAKSEALNAKGFDMDEDTAKDTVDFIFQSPSKEIGIEFQGGEPLVNFPVIEYIIEYAKKLKKKTGKGLHFIIVTNLTLMDHDILKYLIKNKVNLCTSLDGPKELHDKNRKLLGGKSSYENVIQWIDVIKNEYNYNLNALPTTTKFSLKYPKEIVDEYVKRGFKKLRIRQLNNAGFAHSLWEKIGYTPEEYVDFWKKILDYILRMNKRGADFKENMSVLITRKFMTNSYPNYTCWGFPCGAALSQCAYDYKGDIYACDEARSFDVFKIGNVKENNYKEVFLSPNVANIISSSSGLLTECNNCVWRPFCGSCLVCTYGQQNKLIGNMKIDNECMIRKSMLEHIIMKIIKSDDDRKILTRWSVSKEGV